MKKIKIVLIIISLIIVLVTGGYYLCKVLSNNEGTNTDNNIGLFDRLEAPTELTHFNNVLTWKEISGAEEYIIKIDNNEYKTINNYYDLSFLKPGRYMIKIKAISSEVINSKWSEEYLHIAHTLEDQEKADNDFIQSLILANYKDKYPDIGVAKVIMFQINETTIYVIIKHNYSTSCSYKNLEIKIDNSTNSSLLKSINPENFNLKYKTEYMKYDNVNYSKASLEGLLSDLEKEGWIVNVLEQNYSFSRQNVDEKRYYAKYITIAKCEKDGLIKYIIQEKEGYINDIYPDTYSMLLPSFEKGNLLEVKEIYTKVYDNLKYINLVK